MTDATNQDAVSRREMLEVTAAALTAPLLRVVPAVQSAAAAAAAPASRFLTAAEFALLDELTELIIPTDAKSPGARAAGVAAYIDARLAESLEAEWQGKWRSGLAAVDALAHDRSGKPFLQATPDERVALLTQIAAAEKAPNTPAEQFFRELKSWTVRGYYTSKIGIHVDQEYKGNVFQQGEYAGFDAT
ncbi:MAG TPA: gluconate 2-dehydrogenase subunit 3 family protein [Gemmatimonadales bacterium]|nr:gluconate 2-dehydrogenase subunit 3 family protein [Gemmatimonadales bacterium]